MPQIPRKSPFEEVEQVIEGKRRKVPVKLSLDPRLVLDVRAERLKDGLSLSAHVSRLLREDLDRRVDASPPPAGRPRRG
jgi:hypothetical protein